MTLYTRTQAQCSCITGAKPVRHS